VKTPHVLAIPAVTAHVLTVRCLTAIAREIMETGA
jgi:hypothetical protein